MANNKKNSKEYTNKSTDKPVNIILLGDPAAGKATHTRFLVRQYNCLELDMGKELRRLKEEDAKVAAALSSTLDKGKLTQTRIVRDIMHDFISNLPTDKGIVFDGTPKMLGEARLVRKWLKEIGRSDKDILVLYLKVTKDEMINRMNGRGIVVKGQFLKRSDDNLKALKNRIKYYETNIKTVIEYFKKYYSYKTISSMGTIKEVRKLIERQVNEFISSGKI